MLWILIFDLFSAAEGDFLCSGQRLTVESSCGDTVTLPCHFSWRGPPPSSAYELVWQVTQRGADYVVHDDDMQTLANQQQNNRFTNRTSVLEGWPRHGNATLQITDVTESDNGVYTCDLLTTRPFARKICTEIQLIVRTDSLNCGSKKSLTTASGESVQLPCFRRPVCLPHNKRETHWRFMAINTETELELAHLTNAEDQRIAVYDNGTLILQRASSSDSGNYYCYLKGTELCSRFQLRVLDVTTDEQGLKPTPTTGHIYWFVAGGLVIFITIMVVLAICCCHSHQGQKRTDWKSFKNAAVYSCYYWNSKQSQQENSKEDLKTAKVAEPMQKDTQVHIREEDNMTHDTVDSMAKLLT